MARSFNQLLQSSRQKRLRFQAAGVRIGENFRKRKFGFSEPVRIGGNE